MPVEKVLIAVEDEFSAREIVRVLVERNWGRGTEFKVLHAFELPVPYEVPLSYWEVRQQGKSIMEGMVKEMAETLQKSLPGCTSSGEVLEGPAKHVILEAAERWQPDMIVTGSHGRSRMGRLLLGSVSSAITKLARCPVLVVRQKGSKVASETSSEGLTSNASIGP